MKVQFETLFRSLLNERQLRKLDFCLYFLKEKSEKLDT